MIPSPIHRALSVTLANGVQSLLMGGQACILYGVAEFSRDTDLAILATPDNLRRLQAALTELEAAVVAVPGWCNCVALSSGDISAVRHATS